MRQLYFLGTPAFHNELGLHGYRFSDYIPEAVAVGFDPAMNHQQLCRAAWWIARGKPFFATHPDRVCPTDQPTVLIDCGSVCSALTHATGAPPVVVGKPSPRMLTPVLRRNNLAPEQLAVVGDRPGTDIAMAKHAGALSILVLSGKTRDVSTVSEAEGPDLVVEHLGQLGELLCLLDHTSSVP